MYTYSLKCQQFEISGQYQTSVSTAQHGFQMMNFLYISVLQQVLRAFDHKYSLRLVHLQMLVDDSV
jgi:hypothetical protein